MALYDAEIKIPPRVVKPEGPEEDSSLPLKRIGIGVPADRILDGKVQRVCIEEGIDYRGLEPIQRLFLTHYRCPICKLLPLYFLDLTYPKRVRCRKCGQLISFRGNGKWGRIRKKVAFQLMLTVKQ